MNLNKKLKCLLSAMLVLIMLVSAAVMSPATAAQNPSQDAAPTEATDVPAETAAPTDPDGAGFTDTREALEELTEADPTEPDVGETVDVAPSEETQPEEAAIPAREAAEIAQTGIAPQLNVDVKAHRDAAFDNRIVLKWTPFAAAEGYRIYWCDMAVDNAPKKLLTTVKDKGSLTVNGLKRGAKIRFSVVPYATDGGETVYGKSSNVTIATYPNAVTGLSLKSNNTNATVIKWKRVYNIDGYVLMRQYQGKWELLKYLNGRITEYTDRNVKPGYAYYYMVMAYRRDTRGYVRSDPAVLKTLCGLSAPNNDGTTSRGNRGIFAWTKNRYATAYQLTYSLDNKKYKSLGNTAKTSYTTGKFKTGTVVYLRVRPYRIVGKAKTKILGMTKVLKVKIAADKFGVGDTYVEIDISDQHLWYIVNNEVYVSTPVVTGNYNSSDTPTGTYSIKSKARSVSLVGADYVSYVDYWMAFIGSSYGIHDASWRSSFGGNIFRGNGSHGCVNTPYNAVKKIYNHIDVGTPVVIHW